MLGLKFIFVYLLKPQSKRLVNWTSQIGNLLGIILESRTKSVMMRYRARWQ